MIPKLTQTPGADAVTNQYLIELKKAGFTGDLDAGYAARLTMATDNSVYQMLPQAVIFPRSTADVSLIANVAGRAEFQSITFTARGGGTGTNGQSLNSGIIVDMSRYMNRILHADFEQGWVKVEAGVVKDQLNRFLQPYGYFFSPELSTSNRATLGGMINTDACGQGSLVYGKTSDHVLGLKAVLLSGDILETAKQPVEQARRRAQQADNIGAIYQTVMSGCEQNRQLILDKFPKVSRFLTGYDLKHVYSDDMAEFDLSRILTGSEGTLAFITEATLNITKIPNVRRLINIKYDSFDSALRNAALLLEANALSVETIDSKVFNLAREDIVWESVRNLITDVPNKDMQGLNIVEFAGDDASKIEHQLNSLCLRLDELLSAGSAGIIGYQICSDLEDIERIYAMRKKAVGLLGNTKGFVKPVPFVEDTCVPPENLADYIAEFRALLDSYNLSYGMFGHVDAGVLHVRPALDMNLPEHQALLKTISDAIVKLTAKYGGLLWGEHGKGFRAEYSPAFFGEELYQQLRAVKAAFDPDNRLNPGKICAPLGQDGPMIKVDAAKRGSFDRQIEVSVRTAYRGAMDCNGNGLCFNFDEKSPMCPSMKVSADRIHSPKGRAALIREWLRLLAEQNIDPLSIERRLMNRSLTLKGTLDAVSELFSKVGNSLSVKHNEDDFSHQVKMAMSGCLSCKACSTQCPIKIDVPSFKARFLQLYHSRYLRPARDYIVAGVESYAPLMAKAPGFFNFFIGQPVMESLSKRTIGMTDLPLLSTPNLKRQLHGHNALQITLAQLEAMTESQRQKHVLIVQDPFTSYYDAKVVADFVVLIEKLGFKPVLLPFKPNGKAQHIKGFLAKFAGTAEKTSQFLNRIAKLNLPMVGVDPALVLCYRDEYREVLAQKRGDFKVLLVHEWLTSIATNLPELSQRNEIFYLFGHCTETTALPSSVKEWQAIFKRFGVTLNEVKVGCCGMAGTYGHETANLSHSREIYRLSWQEQLAAKGIDHCLTSGYSCRSQIKRFDGKVIKHPLQALLTLI
jgi:FAD/FMN-containing dehydrogenase/Fe-S oxidoreductase